MQLKNKELSSGNLIARAGSHLNHLKSYLSLIYNENFLNYLVSNSDGMCIRSTHGKKR